MSLYDESTSAACCRTLVAQVEQLVGEGRPQDALEFIAHYCQRYPNHGAAFELLGLLEAQLGMPEAAIDSLEMASLIVPLEVLSSRVLSIQYIKVGKEELGIDLLHALGTASHVGESSMRLIAQDLVALNQPKLARDVVVTGLERNAGSAPLWHELCAIETRLGEPANQCLEHVRRAMELRPEVAEYRVTAATLLIMLDLVAEAFQVVSQINDFQLKSMCCECCVWRLICIFDCFDDHRRLKICYDRMRALRY